MLGLERGRWAVSQKHTLILKYDEGNVVQFSCYFGDLFIYTTTVRDYNSLATVIVYFSWILKFTFVFKERFFLS